MVRIDGNAHYSSLSVPVAKGGPVNLLGASVLANPRRGASSVGTSQRGSIGGEAELWVGTVSSWGMTREPRAARNAGGVTREIGVLMGGANKCCAAGVARPPVHRATAGSPNARTAPAVGHSG